MIKNSNDSIVKFQIEDEKLRPGRVQEMNEYKEHQLHEGGSTIPLQVRNSMESLRACSLERNTNIWYLFKHNWRQLTSMIPGEWGLSDI